MALTTVLFDLDGTLLPMDQEEFVRAYFHKMAGKLAPLGYEPEKLVGGLRIVLQLFPDAEGLICIEDNKPAAVAVLNELIKNDKNINKLKKTGKE